MPNLNSDLDDTLEPIVRVLRAALLANLESHLVQIFISADKETVYWGMTKGGFPIAYEGPPMEQAIEWARKYCAQLVTKMDEETKRKLAQVVADAIEQKKGVPGLARNVFNEFENMTRYRSRMRARTETAKALSEGQTQRMKAMGVEYKEWHRTSGYDCGVCEDNENAGVIPMNTAFPSGDMAPPAHPNCMCVLSPVIK